MSARIFIEGADSKHDQIECRKGFRKLLEKLGYATANRLPRLVACGGRNSVFADFKTAHAGERAGGFVAMLIDSEDPVTDGEKTWAHLKVRDKWDQPMNAADEQVLFMTTCMETWIAADLEALESFYDHKLQQNALLPANNLENIGRQAAHDKLTHATRNCQNPYRKGKHAFEIIGNLNPKVLEPLLPSFARMKRILDARL